MTSVVYPLTPEGHDGATDHAQRIGSLVETTATGYEVAATCEWFLLCDHPAVTLRHHPILGNRPICARCQAKFEALS
jgi:hypothetical protein